MADFLKGFWKSSWQTKVGLVVFLFLLLLLPGLNRYELLTFKPRGSKVRQPEIDLQEPAPYPVNTGEPAPFLTAKGVIVFDPDSGTVLYQKNDELPLLPASTTKIMTALIALEHYDLDDTVTISQESNSIGHSMNLVRGEEISIENLLYGILVESGNDAAFALAQNYPGGYSAFVERMNYRAEVLNLNRTHYRNVSGVEQAGHTTTARDLATLAKEALKNPIFAKMVNTKTITIASSDQSTTHILRNINELLGVVPGLIGVKTGWTENAGECLVASTQRNGHQIITVILGSTDRFGETEILTEWAFANHNWENLEI